MKKALLLCMVYFAGMMLYAQTSARNDELKLDADYFLVMKEYAKALDMYLKIIKSEPDNADIKHRIGICYLNSESDKDKAIPYLEEAVQKVSAKYNPNSLKEENASFEAYFALGSAYRVNNELDKAIDAYSKFKEYLDKNDDYNIGVADQYISNCQRAKEMQQKPVNFTAINAGPAINNNKPNYNAVVSGDGKTMVFTSPAIRQGNDIFMSAYSDTGWTKPKNITTTVGTGKFMKTCDLSFDGQTLLLTLEDPENSDIYMSRFSKGRWSKAEALDKTINSKGQETHASLSPDNNTLYFTSNRKGGQGDLDIYKSTREDKGWGKAVNLGPTVNTPFNEETPFVSDDGQILFFSSEGHEGIGGYDIYRYDFGNPAAGVVNLGYPLNTTDNNLFYYPTGDGHSAFYAFAGPGSFGGRDVYAVRVEEIQEVAKIQEVEEVPEVQQVEEVREVPLVAEAQEVPVVEEVREVPVVEEVREVPNIEEVAVVEEAVAVEESQPPASQDDQPVIPVILTDPQTGTAIADEGPARSYAVQIMALKNPVDITYFGELPGLTLVHGSDLWYRYMLCAIVEERDAVSTLQEMVSKGYHDAFIRRKGIVPRYTIQVMAVPGPVVDLTGFTHLPVVSVTRGSDDFCRYTTGEYETLEEAQQNLQHIKDLGYSNAFVARIKIQQ